MVYCHAASGPRAQALRARGVELVERPGANQKVDLDAVLIDLASRGINELHVEAGERLNASFLHERLIDELIVYLAPTLLGAGRDMFAGPAWSRLADAPPLHIADVTGIGVDLRIRARFDGRDAFLS